MELISSTAWSALSSFPDSIWWMILLLSWGVSLEGQPFLMFSLLGRTSFLISPTVLFPTPVFLVTSQIHQLTGGKHQIGVCVQGWGALVEMMVVKGRVELEHSHKLMIST